jgi:NAD(P)-dependent dehydrogenase (short-subunit alcohol dehydrogenase family)
VEAGAERIPFLTIESHHRLRAWASTAEEDAVSEPSERTGGEGSPRVAVVTGGSSGIGREVGRQLAAAGYDVVLTARRVEPLREAAGEIGARWVAADTAVPDQFAAVVAEAGRIDLVVHAAGVMDGTFVRKETIAGFEAVVRANLTTAYVVAHGALPAMGAGGRFVFLSSSSAHAPQPGRSAYSASKAGLNAFAGALAGEVERDGLAVHVVTTGPVATPMLDDVRFPMRTLGAAEVAAAVVWLDTLPPNVVLPEVELSSVDGGPFAPEVFVPEAARRLGRTEL